MKLLLVVDSVELRGIVELERRQRLEIELLLVEATRLGEVIDHQGHMVDAQHSRHIVIPVRWAELGAPSRAHRVFFDERRIGSYAEAGRSRSLEDAFRRAQILLHQVVEEWVVAE